MNLHNAVILFVYNRPEHTLRVLEGLKANKVEKIGSSPLAMFSDQNCSINFQKIFENRTRELV
ncbi:hypothetical protein BG53_11535 [Paenibacillus darwinianus]|uniref:Uncharacterized protein n=1 Tax=Paenibacillus darwinianus TaxID=1380763 RepID=A0A9W5W827_9BACL|nr:hypothetical protein BG53_11535 [Paenibacillus darwinianus]